MYNKDQFENVIPFVQRKPDWVIIAGTADGNEGQCAAKKWPKAMVLGIEPIASQHDWQLINGWRNPRLLLNCALSDTIGQESIRIPENPRCASLCDNRPGELYTVPTTTLDYLHQEFGPFKHAVLWMDIEGWEYRALLGARELFGSRGVQLVNVEEIERMQDNAVLVREFLDSYGFELVHTWNEQPGLCCDRVYRRKE